MKTTYNIIKSELKISLSREELKAIFLSRSNYDKFMAQIGKDITYFSKMAKRAEEAR